MPKPNTLLQEERKKRGWTQEQLAEMIEAAPDSIGNWESGRRGTSRYYQTRLVDVFGLPPERLGFPASSAEVSALPNTVDPPTAVLGEPVTALSTSPLPGRENVAQIERVLRGREGDENRHNMLWQMRNTWIDGVLKHSLDPGVLITPDLVELPEALENPWHLQVRETNGIARGLPKGTSIVQMYDIANEELLILGEPGAGKTTLLLDLARELLIRAEQNTNYPIPVILNLTTWTRKRSTLTEWMVEEMQSKYRVPEGVAHAWIADEQIIVLLDGLDEIEIEALTSCFKAIREYQDTRVRGLLVICCRRGDYFAQSVRLSLQKAVLIQPLTREQIYGYLTTADDQLETVRQALQDDPELEAICTTPLLLNIATRSYQIKAAAILTHGESVEEQRQQVFKAYVERMLSRRGIELHYNQQQTIRWLAWLAEQMQKRSQSEFYLERMQPTWLSDERMRDRFRHTVIRIVYGIESLFFAGLFALLPGGVFKSLIGSSANYLGQSRSDPSSEALGWIAPGLGGSSASLGIILALVTILVSFMISSQTLNLSPQKIWKSLIEAVRSGAIVGGILGTIAVFVFLPKLGIVNSLARGADVGLLGGLLIGFQSGLIAWLHKKNTSQGHLEKPLKQHLFASLCLKRFLDRVGNFVVFSGCAGIGYGGIYALLIKGITPDIVTYSLITALFFGLLFSWGNAAEQFQGIGEHIRPAETVTWSWTTARHTLGATLRKGGIVGLVVLICVMGMFGIASGIFYGPSYGLRFGFICGSIIGLTGAITGILTGVLNSGWKTAILPDHQIFQPNEGTRRSVRNAVFAACLCGPIGGIASGLASGLAFGYIGGFSRWPILAIVFALIFSVIFAFQFVNAYGGIAWLQHYLLRWYLWRSGNFPANCRRFFDYASERIFMIKIGGGYMFAHRLLLDYFASLRAREPYQEKKKKPSHVKGASRQR